MLDGDDQRFLQEHAPPARDEGQPRMRPVETPASLFDKLPDDAKMWKEWGRRQEGLLGERFKEGALRSRMWAFTINNYSEVEVKLVQEMILDKNKEGKAMGFGTVIGRAEVEVAPTTGTPHIQGFVMFVNARTLGGMKKLLGDRAHIEKCLGEVKPNWDYCGKTGAIIAEKGNPDNEEDPPVNATRSQVIEFVMKKITGGDLEIERLRYRYAFRKVSLRQYWDQLLQFRDDYAKEEGLMVEQPWNGNLRRKNFWLWGKTRAGKSYFAQNYASTTIGPWTNYPKNLTKWWDGYGKRQRVVIIEEPSASTAKHFPQFEDQIKVWGDRYPFEAEKKGGSLTISPGRFYLIVCSNYSIDEVFPQANPLSLAAIKQRFLEIELKPWDDHSGVARVEPPPFDISILLQ